MGGGDWEWSNSGQERRSGAEDQGWKESRLRIGEQGLHTGSLSHHAQSPLMSFLHLLSGLNLGCLTSDLGQTNLFLSLFINVLVPATS